ncbi:MAG: aminopeptidase [Sphaerochaetaceae bacterium]|nr:aminopeptidase [Sphaerochaetaceae bacterium]
MDNYYRDKYARFILEKMLRLEKGEKLTINSNEETFSFAKKLSYLASEITGVTSTLVYIVDGKVESVDEIDPPYQAKETGKVAMLHLASFPECNFDKDAELGAKELQEFRLLSDPIVLDRRISVPWATVYVPSPYWAEFLYGSGETVDRLWMDISELYDLDEESTDLTISQEKVLRKRISHLESLGISALHVKGPNCDLYLPLAKGASFQTSAVRLKEGRYFYPSYPCEDVIVPVDFKNASGHFTTTRKFRLFDRFFENASVTIENGKLTGFTLEDGNDEINCFFKSDSKSTQIGEIILCDHMTHASRKDLCLGIPIIDRMRTTTIVLGGVTPEAITEEDETRLEENGINTSFTRLELPIGSKDLQISALLENGDEVDIIQDGSFTDEF